MANSYVDPNFNIDTSTNVAGLIALKGSAPALTDKIYVYNGATLTIEQALSILLISLGETSSGAAGAGNRYGYLTVNAGVTVTFKGDPTYVNSGVKSNPASADTSSRGSILTINGASGSNAVFTNDGDALASSKRWQFNMTFGSVQADYLTARFPYHILFAISPNATYTTASSMKIDHFTATGLNVDTCSVVQFLANCSIPVSLRFWDITVSAAVVGINISSWSYLASGGSLDNTGLKITCIGTSAYTLANVRHTPSATPGYSDGFQLGQADTRPTQVVPAGLTLTDMQDGTVKVEIGNAASYRTLAVNGIEDYIQLFDASGNARGGACSLTRYNATLDRKPINCFIVAGVPLSAMANWYAKATSDGRNYSAASAVASTITPTFKPAVAKIMADAGGYGQAGAEFTPTLPLNKVHQDHGGTLDLPALTALAADDTLEGVAGSIALNQILAPRGTAVAEAHANGDVRFGVGSGTCKVPAKADVRLGVAVDVADTGELKSALISFALDADDNSIAVGGTIDFSAAAVAISEAVTGATVTAKIHNAATGAEIATVFTAAGQDFVGGVARTLAAIKGSAPTWTDDQGVGDYELRVTVSDDEITTEVSRYGFAVIDTTPGRPHQSAAPTAGDGSVTLHGTAAAETDVLYALWRTSAGEFSAPSEAFKRTGSGDLAVTGLTNELRYGFLLVAKAGALWSLPSEEEGFATPTAGSTAAAGVLARPAQLFKTLLAACPAYQAMVAAGSAEEALDSIHKFCVPGAAADIAAKRPFSVVAQGNAFTRTRDASGARDSFYGAGDVAWLLERAVPAALADHDHHAEAADDFMNAVGAVIEDIEELAGTGAYLNVTGIELAAGPHRTDPKAKATEGDCFQAQFRVSWGGR